MSQYINILIANQVLLETGSLAEIVFANWTLIGFCICDQTLLALNLFLDMSADELHFPNSNDTNKHKTQLLTLIELVLWLHNSGEC